MNHLLPDDPHDRALRSHVHPPDWAPPTPRDRYHLVVIGGGPAGLVAALGAAGLGARVALVERALLGGDCLNAGCVPSKALLASAHAAAAARAAAALGVHVGEVRVDFPAVMARVRAIRAAIAPHDGAARLRDAGIDVFLGHGRFTGPDRVEVDGATLRFSRAVIATGARAATPPFPGADEVDVLDHERLFQLTEQPRRLVVLGAGPIGVEMAQAFARLGTEVTLVDRAERVLPREDPEASEVLGARLAAEGVRLRLGARVERLERDGDGAAVVLTVDGTPERVVGDRVLAALGRRPNLDGLGLEAAGVASTPQGVVVDAHLRTANPRIYAAGDVASPLQFTHAADAMARIVLQNALFAPSARVDRLVVPWATYTSPEVAHVGPPWDALRARSDLQALTVPLADTDRARTEGHDAGFAKAWVDRRGGLVAVTIVAPGAGELVHEATLAITHGIGLGGVARTLHAYPTEGELLKKLGDAWARGRLTPTRRGWVQAFLRWRHG